jgi:Flp pilus assembly protein TadG
VTLPMLPKMRIVRDYEAATSGRVPGETASAILPRDKLEKACRPCRRNRRGAAAVEFAFVAPVFFLLVFGMIEFGRAMMVEQILTNASREGARLAILDGSTISSVNTTVTGYLSNVGLSGATITVSPDPAATTSVYGTPITVTVRIPFANVSWLPTPIFLSGKTLGASSVMRRETVQ